MRVARQCRRGPASASDVIPRIGSALREHDIVNRGADPQTSGTNEESATEPVVQRRLALRIEVAFIFDGEHECTDAGRE